MRTILTSALTAALVCSCFYVFGSADASRNSSGTMSAANGPYVPGTVISSSMINSRFADIENELTDSLDRSGKGGMLAALRGVDGTVAAPAYSWTNEPGSGWYRIGVNDYGFALSGSKQVEIGASLFFVNQIIGAHTVQNQDGTVGSPAYSFTSETGTGLYRIGANDLGMAVGGVKQLELTTAAATIVQPLTASSTANVAGNFSVATNKFNVTASNGNASTAGTFQATGAITASAGLVSNGELDATANIKVGSGNVISQIHFATCTLSGASPSTCTTSPPNVAGTNCICMLQNSSLTVTNPTCAVSAGTATCTMANATAGTVLVLSLK